MSRSLPGTRTLLRGLTALLAVVALALGVSACRVQPGAAGFVGDQRISETTVETYLLATGPTQDAQADQPSAREYAVTYLVRVDLYTAYLTRQKVDLSATALEAARQKVTVGQEDAIAGLPAQAATLGLNTKFVDLLIRFTALQSLAATKAGSQDAAALTAAVNQGGPSVKLSPRYGAWAETEQSVTPGSTTPDYLTLSTTGTTDTAGTTGSTPVPGS